MQDADSEAALVLRRTEFGESDLILGLYCRSLGKLSALARGARRSRKRFGAGLGLFTLSEVALTSRAKSDLWTLVSAEPRRTYDALAQDVRAMAHGSYGTELVREMTVDEQPDSDVFDLLVGLYESLQADGPKAGRLRVFELRLLSLLGLAPILDRCACCDSSDLEQGMHLNPERGGVVCASCSADARGYGVRALSFGASQLLADAQAQQCLSGGDKLDGRSEAVEARQAMLSLLYWHVGKPLKSVEFIAKLSNRR